MLFISPKKFVLKINFCFDFIGQVGKRLDKKARVNFKIYVVTNWETKNHNIHMAQYLKR